MKTFTDQELRDLMHKCWLEAKDFYTGKTDRYFFDYYQSLNLNQTEPEPLTNNKQLELICPDCKGEGKTYSGTAHCGDDTCLMCRGKGQILVASSR